MTPQELKTSILQLAIQGKLVPQLPEEGTGEELYQRIQTEKQRLIKAGMIKKEKPLPEIAENEIPYDIPENWEWVKLGSICSVVTGKKDANFGSETGDYLFFTCAKEPIRCSSFSFTGESILMAGNGDISNISYYAGDFEAYQRTYVLQPYIAFSYLKYVLYHLQYNWVTYNNDKMFGTAIPYIRLGNVQNYLVALPPIEEQKRIVAKIEELLPYIDRYEQAWSKLEDFNKRFPADMQKSILQMAIQGKLVEQRPEEGTGEELFQQIQAEKQRLIKAGTIKKEKPLPEIAEDEIPFDIPESWKWVRVGDVFNVGTGMTPLKTEAKFYQNGTVPWVTSSLTSQRHIADVETKVTEYALENTSLAIYPAHTLIVAMYGQGKTRGQISELLIDATINQACAALGNIVTDKYLVTYTYYCFLFNYEVLRKKAEGTSQPNLNLGKIKETLIPLPPLAEQKRIVAKLEEILPLCDRLK